MVRCDSSCCFLGIEWSNTHRSVSVHYPWQKSSYLQERTTQLQNVLNELDPHQPVSEAKCCSIVSDISRFLHEMGINFTQLLSSVDG